jgi:hypothetical protein
LISLALTFSGLQRRVRNEGVQWGHLAVLIRVESKAARGGD